MEKCFCHLNGYKVKDADARAKIAEIETKLENLPTGGGGGGGKMYLHKIVSTQTTETPWGEIHFNLITSDATPYNVQSIVNEKVFKMLDGTAFNAYVNLSGTGNSKTRKSGVFYVEAGNHSFESFGVFIGMLFGDGSTATLMLDNHNETLTDEVIEL